MATYKYDKFVEKNTSDEFDKIHPHSTKAPWAGIYRCAGCGREIAIAQSHVLPPQNHHQHSTQQGEIRWRLIAYADHEPKA
jgi:hypothetical protein